MVLGINGIVPSVIVSCIWLGKFIIHSPLEDGSLSATMLVTDWLLYKNQLVTVARTLMSEVSPFQNQRSRQPCVDGWSFLTIAADVEFLQKFNLPNSQIIHNFTLNDFFWESYSYFRNKIENTMTNREAEFFLQNAMQTLELIHQNREEFEEIEGKSGVQERIDNVLDKINYYRTIINNNKDEN